MKKTFGRKITALLLCAMILSAAGMSGCGNAESESSAASVSSQQNSASDTSSDKDDDTSKAETADTKIELTGESAKVTGSGASVEGGTITISSAGTYTVSGKLNKGNIVIEAGKDDEVCLVLSGAEIYSEDTAAVYASKCGKTIIMLADNTENVLSDGKDYVKTEEESDDDSPNAAVYVKDDLTIRGNGSLTVKANAHNGITSKDSLSIESGSISVTAVNHCITGKDALAVSGGEISVSTDGGDGLKSTNTDDDKGSVTIENAKIDITCAKDGIQAEHNITIGSGTISIVTGGGSENNKTVKNDMGFHMNNTDTDTDTTESSNYKGIKAGGDISISGGTFTIDAYDDAVHSNSNISINGGSFTIKAGDDGVHADSELTISNGTVKVEKSYEGLEAEVINITDGTIDITADDDGINCAGGNDQSGFGGMDGNMQFAHGFRFDRNQSQSSDGQQMTPPEMPQSSGGQQMTPPEMPQGSDGQQMTPPEMPQGSGGQQMTPPEMPQGSGGQQMTPPEMPQSSGGQQMTEQSGNGQQNDQPQMPGNADSNAALNISGGTIYVNAQGDGLDSNGALNITGGTIVVNGTTNGGNGIIDHDGSCTVSGGTLIGAGTSDMLEMPGDTSTLNTVAVLFDKSVSADTLVYVTDSSGKVIAAMSPKKNYGCFILSSKDLKAGESYTVYTGGKADGEAVNGYYSGNSASGGTKYVTFTLSENKVTYVDSSGITQYRGMR